MVVVEYNLDVATQRNDAHAQLGLATEGTSSVKETTESNPRTDDRGVRFITPTHQHRKQELL